MTDGTPKRAGMQILTERLILREFVSEDATAFAACHADPSYTEFYGPEESEPERLRQLVETFSVWSAEVPRRNWQLAIVERAGSNELVGTGGVRTHRLEGGCGELGLGLAPRLWGRGLATEAARALLHFGFADLVLREIIGTSVTQNVRVARLVERLGFERIGTRSGPDWMQARGWNQTEWRLTAEAWRAGDRLLAGLRDRRM